MQNTTKNKFLQPSENTVISTVCDVMQWIFILSFLTSFFILKKPSDIIFTIFFIFGSFWFWKLKINYHKFLLTKYIEVYENNPIDSLPRRQKRAAKRYFKKHPIKIV